MKAKPHVPELVASPHYVLGGGYLAGGMWYYPAEAYGLDATGIGEVVPPGDGLTADGELPDGSALTASMQTIQLPAIVEVTDLDNGRQIMVRVNDRGPADPARLIGLSPRAGLLLAMTPGHPARVRVRVDTALSHALVDQLGGGPKLDIATAPPDAVQAEALPAPGAAAGAGARSVIGGEAPEAAAARVPDRLPEHIVQTSPDPGQLFIRAGSFGRFSYANTVAAKLAGLGADVLRSRDGRTEVFEVRAGPFGSIAGADAALADAIRQGVIDARIVVENGGS